MKKNQKKKTDIGWALFMLKIRFELWRHELKQKIQRALLCKRGWHHYQPKSVEVSKSMKSKKGMRVVLRVEWLECSVCGTLFFATPQDKKKYQNYKERENKLYKKLFDSMLKRESK